MGGLGHLRVGAVVESFRITSFMDTVNLPHSRGNRTLSETARYLLKYDRHLLY